MWISKAEYNKLVQNSELGAKVAMQFAETLAKLNETQLELIQVKQELSDVKDYANHLKTSRDEVIEEYNAKIKSLIFTRDEFERQFKEAEAAYESEHAEATEYFNEYYRTKKELDKLKGQYNELDIKFQGLITTAKAADAVIEKLKQLLTQAEEKNKEVEQEREELAKEASGLAKELTHAELDLALYKKAFDDIAHAFGDEFRYLLMEEAIAEEKHSIEARYATWAVSNLWFVVHDIMKNAGWRVKDANT
jgi:chromosome segregation ATPase